jgi:hypothetical protein
LLIARSTSSQASVSGSDPTGEALQSEHASRSCKSKPVSASLHKIAVASLPKMMKPGTGDEAMGKSSRRAVRGERGQRAWTDRSRNLGDPQGQEQLQGINNR